MKKLTSMILILATICVMSITVVSCKCKNKEVTTTSIEASIQSDATSDIVADTTADVE